MAKLKIKQLPVSKLKNQLLEIVRAVERGHSFQITKDKKPVAILCPLPIDATTVIGYSEITINGSAEDLPEEAWSFDSENL